MEALATILHRTADNAILDAVDRIYAEGWRDDYAGMLRDLRAVKLLPSVMKILIKPEEDGTADVSGLDLAQGSEYSLMLSPWGEWLAMAVDRSSVPGASDADVIAHCIAEIAWGGWSDADRDEFLGDLKERKEEIDDMLAKSPVDRGN